MVPNRATHHNYQAFDGFMIANVDLEIDIVNMKFDEIWYSRKWDGTSSGETSFIVNNVVKCLILVNCH